MQQGPDWQTVSESDWSPNRKVAHEIQQKVSYLDAVEILLIKCHLTAGFS
jgi:hypothetical protein